ncbi:MAG: alanine racemase [Oscillospiraceae bacterium]
MELLKRSWAVVDLDAIADNIKTIKNILSPHCMLMGVVKADGYGHGDKYISDELVRLGVDWFGVSNIDEAISLRKQGIYHPILIFGHTPARFAKILNQYNITQSVFSLEYAKSLAATCEKEGVTIDAHIKIDTGMSRLGFVVGSGLMGTAIDEISQVYSLPQLNYTGIFTHFPVADETNETSKTFTLSQFALFNEVISKLENLGMSFKIKHCCNSAATICYPQMHMDMVRPGIITYGLSPSADCNSMIPLKPAMNLYSTITLVKNVCAGTSVSYGRTFIAQKDMKVATVAIGYADGIERELSDKGCMLVRGKRARIIGRVCMDQLMLDVTDIPDVSAQDIATIVGTDGENTITFEEMAAIGNTVNYEKICIIGKRVPRIYMRDGKEIGVVDYVRKNIDM